MQGGKALEEERGTVSPGPGKTNGKKYKIAQADLPDIPPCPSFEERGVQNWDREGKLKGIEASPKDPGECDAVNVIARINAERVA